MTSLKPQVRRVLLLFAGNGNIFIYPGFETEIASSRLSCLYYTFYCISLSFLFQQEGSLLSVYNFIYVKEQKRIAAGHA